MGLTVTIPSQHVGTLVDIHVHAAYKILCGRHFKAVLSSNAGTTCRLISSQIAKVKDTGII